MVSEFTKRDYEVIARDYADLKEAARKRCAGEDELAIVQKAFDFASEAHKGVRRRSGEPYILHPIAVAKIVVGDIGLGYKSIAAALLHDVVEDTDYTVEDIRKLFGDRIALLVDGLTKIKTMLDNDAKAPSKSLQAENLKRILLTLNEDVRVVLIKLADRLHNCRTIEFMPEYKRDKILSETMFIFIPLAHRLGLYGVKSEMENIWLRYKEPEAFNDISEKINRNIIDKEKEIDEFIRPIDKALKAAGFDFEIKKRVKTPYSIWQKMVTKDITFDQVYDLYAVRIIFIPKSNTGESERDQCYHVFTTITGIYRYKPDRIRDWVKHPKNNGYEALHCTLMSHSGIWIEMQIRTKRMNDIAEHGIAAHWAYKQDGYLDEHESEMDKWISKVKEILVNPDVNALELLDIIHNDLNATDIFVFTPKGDQVRIQKGATALDFAYQIHTKIGNTAIAAKANMHLVPLSYVLKGGDQVEIITAASEYPKPEWLKFVQTHGAKSAIITALKKQGIALPVDNDEVLKEKSRQWFSWLRQRKEASSSAESKYIIADCCKPIPGDSILGFRDPSDGKITIHKKTCPVANNMASKYGDRIVEPDWADFVQKSFVARLSIRGIDRVGILNQITNYLALVMSINIRRIEIQGDSGVFYGAIDLYVQDRDALDKVIHKIKRISGIESVIRTDI